MQEEDEGPYSVNLETIRSQIDKTDWSDLLQSSIGSPPNN